MKRCESITTLPRAGVTNRPDQQNGAESGLYPQAGRPLPWRSNLIQLAHESAVAELCRVQIPMQAFYEDKTLLETMTVIVPGLGVTRVVLGQDPESLTFLVNLEKTESQEQTVSTQFVDAHTLKLTLTNWDNVLGTGLLTPLEVGTFNKRKLYLYLFVRKVGSKSAQCMATMSFYTGEEVVDG